MLQQQEQRSDQQSGKRHDHDANPANPPPPPLPNYHFPQPPSPSHNHYNPPPPQLSTIDPKSPLANHVHLTPWPLHYRATSPPKYYGNADPRKFLMSYEATIASVGGDVATLDKSPIISLDDAAANWCSRLPPGCIHFWSQLKEKFLLYFQGFQTKHDSEEDFLSCTQREKVTLPNFYRRFLQLKAQAPRCQTMRLSPKQSKPCEPDLYTVIPSESDPRQC
jgi:hypothetical protein